MLSETISKENQKILSSIVFKLFKSISEPLLEFLKDAMESLILLHTNESQYPIFTLRSHVILKLISLHEKINKITKNFSNCENYEKLMRLISQTHINLISIVSLLSDQLSQYHIREEFSNSISVIFQQISSIFKSFNMFDDIVNQLYYHATATGGSDGSLFYVTDPLLMDITQFNQFNDTLKNEIIMASSGFKEYLLIELNVFQLSKEKLLNHSMDTAITGDPKFKDFLAKRRQRLNIPN